MRNRSFHRLQKLPCFAQQGLNLPSFGDRFPGEQAVLAGILVCPWRAGSRRTAVHEAAFFAAHRRRAAQAAGTDFCAATWAGQHRAGIAGVIAHGCAGPLSETITLACCVTLPTMALPPSWIDTFCTVMAGSPLV